VPRCSIPQGFLYLRDPKHPVCHTVPTLPGPLVFARACWLDAERLESARKEFAVMKSAGIILSLGQPFTHGEKT